MRASRALRQQGSELVTKHLLLDLWVCCNQRPASAVQPITVLYQPVTIAKCWRDANLLHQKVQPTNMNYCCGSLSSPKPLIASCWTSSTPPLYPSTYSGKNNVSWRVCKRSSGFVGCARRLAGVTTRRRTCGILWSNPARWRVTTDYIAACFFDVVFIWLDHVVPGVQFPIFLFLVVRFLLVVTAFGPLTTSSSSKSLLSTTTLQTASPLQSPDPSVPYHPPTKSPPTLGTGYPTPTASPYAWSATTCNLNRHVALQFLFSTISHFTLLYGSLSSLLTALHIT